METLALLACIILLSCNKSDIQNNFNPCAVDPCNCTGIDSIKLNYSLKWNQPFHLKSNRSVSTTPFTIGDVLITSYLSDDGLFSIVNGNNSLTGEKIWEQLYNKSDKAVLHHYGTKHNYNNSLILTFNFHIYAINPMNGSVIWDVTKVPENVWSDPSSAIIDNNIYYGGRTIDQNPKKSFLFRRDLNYPQINEVLLEYTDPDNYDLLLGMPCLTINHYKDSILIFIGKGFNQDNSKSNYFAYNLNNKQIEWIREFYGADGKWQAPIIVNNKIIVAPTSTSVACLDATTGDLIWQKELPDKGFMQTGDMVIEEGVLLVLNNMGSLYAFHPET
ncbi:MAG: PQQ-like beta-propeller repeat protein, partial [Saprospiraceae bacterium]|nr:PQQ-like beta-propeller repeat protein [Saprospiraceae bacterium]